MVRMRVRKPERPRWRGRWRARGSRMHRGCQCHDIHGGREGVGVNLTLGVCLTTFQYHKDGSGWLEIFENLLLLKNVLQRNVV